MKQTRISHRPCSARLEMIRFLDRSILWSLYLPIYLVEPEAIIVSMMEMEYKIIIMYICSLPSIVQTHYTVQYYA